MPDSLKSRLARLERAAVVERDPLRSPDYARELYAEILNGRAIPMPESVDVAATVELWMNEPGAFPRRFVLPEVVR